MSFEPLTAKTKYLINYLVIDIFGEAFMLVRQTPTTGRLLE